MVRRQAWRTGAESDGTQALNSNGSAADMSGTNWNHLLGGTRTLNAEWAPDMAKNACLYTEDGTTFDHGGYGDQASTFAAGVNTYSLYYRAVGLGRRYLATQFLDSAAVNDGNFYFDTLTGKMTGFDVVLGTTTYVGSVIYPARFGFWKVVLTLNLGSDGRFFVLCGSQAGNPAAESSKRFGMPSYAGNSRDMCLAWRPKAVATVTQFN